jgi:DNA repair exonuclease SbcCD nuclease subunit
VGPADFTFTTAPDVIRGSDLPAEFAAVLSGHIHRHQVLGTDLRGRPLPAPVLYPGSVERTALAEKDERKGFMTLDVAPGGGGGRLSGWRFHELPARPMLVHEIRLPLRSPPSLESRIRALLADVPRDSVLRLRVTGTIPDSDRRILSAERLRALAPPTMNLELRLPDEESAFRGRRDTRRDRLVAGGDAQRARAARSSILELPL